MLFFSKVKAFSSYAHKETKKGCCRRCKPLLGLFAVTYTWSIFSLKESEIIRKWIVWLPWLFPSTSSPHHPFSIISNNLVSWSDTLAANNPGSFLKGFLWCHLRLAIFHSFPFILPVFSLAQGWKIPSLRLPRCFRVGKSCAGLQTLRNGFMCS